MSDICKIVFEGKWEIVRVYTLKSNLLACYIIKLFNYMRLFVNEIIGHYHNPWDALYVIYVIQL